MERWYNGPDSKLMDKLYDRLEEHTPISDYRDWQGISLYLSREIKRIEEEHLEEIESLVVCRDHWKTSYDKLKKEMQRREDYIESCLV